MKAPAVFNRFVGGLVQRYQNRKAYQAIDSRRGWHRILEPFTGAFQRNIEVDRDCVLAYHAVYSCITLISQDIGKMRIKLMEMLPSGIWKETTSAAFTPVLNKPNDFQNRIKFTEYWITSKLVHGNTYVLKIRDSRDVVVKLIILDPCRVTVLIADNGDVFYRLKTDKLRGLPDEVIVPATEIIHDRMICLFHPLVGVSPIYACGLAAMQGVSIQNNSATFFGNHSRPGGILTAPGHIEDDTAARVKEQWEERFGGANVGRTAVLGDGLEYKPIAITFEDSQMIEQLKWTAEMVASCFHVPPWMIGVGAMPAVNNTEAATQLYYSQCLQALIESMELCLDEGLGIGVGVRTGDRTLGVELDLGALLRMDTASRFEVYSSAIGGGWLKPNEARLAEDLEAVVGGDTPYMQQQNYSLSELNIRRTQTEAKAAESDDGVDVQATAMNGAQVTSLQGIITAAALGQIPIESARAAISAAFPLLEDEEIDQMIDPLEGFDPVIPGSPTSSNGGNSNDDDDAEEITDEELEEETRAMWLDEGMPT